MSNEQLTMYHELIDCLEDCVRNASVEERPWLTQPAVVAFPQFRSDGVQEIERIYVYESSLKSTEENVRTLVLLLRRLMSNYLNPKIDCIGNGLLQLNDPVDRNYHSSTTDVHVHSCQPRIQSVQNP